MAQSENNSLPSTSAATTSLVGTSYREREVMSIEESVKRDIAVFENIDTTYSYVETSLRVMVYVFSILATGLGSAASGIGIEKKVYNETTSILSMLAAIASGVLLIIQHAYFKIGPKIEANRKLLALAKNSALTIKLQMSDALTDNVISDKDFRVLVEIQKLYIQQKESVRRNFKSIETQSAMQGAIDDTPYMSPPKEKSTSV